MIRSLWFLVKVSLFVSLVIWVAEQKGSISIDWAPYKLTFHVGFFFMFVLALVVVGILLFSFIKALLDFPKTMERYQNITDRERGYRALTIGLTAVAAGDSKNAVYQAHRAKRFLKDKDGLAKLLEAQAARLEGREQDASRIFASLIEHKDAAFLGLRGLLQTALETGDNSGALEVGQRALELYPKQPWIIQVVYDLQIKLKKWEEASKTLYIAEKNGVIPTNKANSDRVAMYLAQADECEVVADETGLYRALMKAYKWDKRFIPTVERLVRMYIQRGKTSAAISMIEESWKITPHPTLVPLWEMLMPKAKFKDSAARVKWYERLLALNPESFEGLMAISEVFIQEGLWGEARKNLEKAESIQITVRLYKLWARLEERATRDDDAVRGWLEKAADAPRDKVWICSQTGHVYPKWMPVSDLGYFNSIIWDFPAGRYLGSGMSYINNAANQTLLEAYKT